MNSVQEFLERQDKATTKDGGRTYHYPSNHWQWDRDILRRLNDRELILNQE